MKKYLKIGIAAVFFAILIAFSGCVSVGSDGRFPYDVASENGYTGSQGSWLAAEDTPSTHERRLYEEARAEGYGGTFLDFLKELDLYDPSFAAQTALRSVVAVEARFRTTVNGKEDYASGGSGVVIAYDEAEAELTVVTNYHVVYSPKSAGNESIAHISDTIYLFLYGNGYTGAGKAEDRALVAEYVGGAMDYDIAVLRVKGEDTVTDSSGDTHTNREILNGSGVAVCTAADSDSVTVGEEVFVVGNGAAKGIAVTTGTLSVDAEYVNITSSDEKSTLSLLEMRTDATVNHGNSGGGLFNAAGELIGVVNARSEQSGVLGFGYAIPSNLALSVARNILDNEGNGHKGAMRATLGISLSSESSRSAYDEATGKLYQEEIVMVAKADFTSFGYRAGLRVGDSVYSVALIRGGQTVYEKAVTRRHILTNLMFDVRPGDTVKLGISRGGESKSVELSFDYMSAFSLFD